MMSALQTMCTDRRDFLKASAGVVGASLLAPKFSFAATDDIDRVQQRQDVPDLIKRLPRMTRDVVPITEDERMARIAKAQRSMCAQTIDALSIYTGSSM